MPNLSARNGKSLASSERRGDGKLEDLIQLLVSRVAQINGCSPKLQEEKYAEEVLFDVDVDGARYLLVRLPKSSKARVQLSPREHEIVRMVALGHPNKVIAEVLSISSWTVCTHLRRIFAKLGVGSRAAMVARLLEVGRSDATAGQGPSANGNSNPSRDKRSALPEGVTHSPERRYRNAAISRRG
ncbi:MAG: hypothetical protein DMG22_18220 [Acidobacteria bacterium]|nr:MAG: hypothetical protein DMG22_18220 [Acidobacteriota bacterium]